MERIFQLLFSFYQTSGNLKPPIVKTEYWPLVVCCNFGLFGFVLKWKKSEGLKRKYELKKSRGYCILKEASGLIIDTLFIFFLCTQCLPELQDARSVSAVRWTDGRTDGRGGVRPISTIRCLKYSAICVKFYGSSEVFKPVNILFHPIHSLCGSLELNLQIICRGQLKCDGTRAETRFRLSGRNGRFNLNRPGGVSSVDYWQPRCAYQR